MTIKEIEKLEIMLKNNTVDYVLNFLSDEKLVKQREQGLIDIDIPNRKAEYTTVKAYPLSDNLCVIDGNNNEIKGFKSFNKKLNLTHRKTGIKLQTIKIKKADLFKLAENLENILNLKFEKVEDFKKQNPGAINEALDLIHKYKA